MAYRFMQQDAGPTWAQHHTHLTRRGWTCVKVGQCELHGFVHIALCQCVVKVIYAKATATTG